jgi:hypothetical protein
MSDSTLWRVIDAELLTLDPELDTLSMSLQSEGKVYAVACTGPKGMGASEFTTTLRAAAAAIIRSAGGDMSSVGAQERDDSDPTFDTGDQRAN